MTAAGPSKPSETPGPRLPAGTTCWVVTDGKAGDETQCVGVAVALGLTPDIRRVAPRPPWSWFMPWGPVDPREAPGAAAGPLAGPWPDILIASGRRAVASMRAVKAASGGKTFTVFLKDPRTGAGSADFIWVPQHDRLRGPNVLATLTSPHAISAERLDDARRDPPAPLTQVRSPRVALVLGGDSRHHVFTQGDIDRLCDHLARLAATGVGLMATASRRTPEALARRARELVASAGGFFWNGEGANPYVPMLALADAVVVTSDSVNMVGEACATGKPVLVFEPTPREKGGRAKAEQFIEGLRHYGAVRSFQGTLESYAYKPLNSTPEIAAKITRSFLAATVRRTG